MGYPTDALEWLPKWRDLPSIEHRRHREAVETAVAGLNEGDDIVLIGGALAGTTTARRAIAEKWAPDATVEWMGPFADEGEWLEEHEVWSALLAEVRERAGETREEMRNRWTQAEHDVGRRPHDETGAYVSREIANAGMRLVTIEHADRWHRSEPELAFAEQVETVTDALDAVGVRSSIILEGSILHRSKAPVRCPRGSRVVYVGAYGRGLDAHGQDEGANGPDREEEAREVARICEAMQAQVRAPLAQAFTPAQRETLLTESHGNVGTLIEWAGCAIGWARGRPVTWSEYGLGGAEEWKSEAREGCIEAAEATVRVLRQSERRKRKALTAGADSFGALMQRLQSEGDE